MFIKLFSQNTICNDLLHIFLIRLADIENASADGVELALEEKYKELLKIDQLDFKAIDLVEF